MTFLLLGCRRPVLNIVVVKLSLYRNHCGIWNLHNSKLYLITVNSHLWNRLQFRVKSSNITSFLEVLSNAWCSLKNTHQLLCEPQRQKWNNINFISLTMLLHYFFTNKKKFTRHCSRLYLRLCDIQYR